MSDEFKNFDRTMRDLISVPHDEIKAVLDAEKAAKREKKKRDDDSRKSSGGTDKDAGRC